MHTVTMSPPHLPFSSRRVSSGVWHGSPFGNEWQRETETGRWCWLNCWCCFLVVRWCGLAFCEYLPTLFRQRMIWEHQQRWSPCQAQSCSWCEPKQTHLLIGLGGPLRDDVGHSWLSASISSSFPSLESQEDMTIQVWGWQGAEERRSSVVFPSAAVLGSGHTKAMVCCGKLARPGRGQMISRPVHRVLKRVVTLRKKFLAF